MCLSLSPHTHAVLVVDLGFAISRTIEMKTLLGMHARTLVVAIAISMGVVLLSCTSCGVAGGRGQLQSRVHTDTPLSQAQTEAQEQEQASVSVLSDAHLTLRWAPCIIYGTKHLHDPLANMNITNVWGI